MRHSWGEAKPPAVKHPTDIVARGRVSGREGDVPLSAQTRSGCRETLTSVAHDRLSPGQCLKVPLVSSRTRTRELFLDSTQQTAGSRLARPRFPTAKSGAVYTCNIHDANFFSLQPSHSMRSWFSRSGASDGIQWLASSICS